MQSYTGKKVLILGTGISGQGAFKALSHLDADCVLADEKDGDYEFGRIFDLIVISPSFPVWHSAYGFAEKNGIEIIGELELGFQLFNGVTAAVTGTNGKTTTTSLLGEFLKANGKKTSVCGNIGKSFAESAVFEESDYAAVEVSSFQLESIKQFKPRVAAITNISADHLDRHGSIENYAAHKTAVAKNQDENDYLILSSDDIPLYLLEGFCPKSKVIYTSLSGKTDGAYLHGGKIFYMDEYIIDRSHVKLQGLHNVQNVLTAVAAAKLLGVKNESLVKTLVSFDSDAHRLKFVDICRGKSFFNDSKGTNTGAALKAAESMDGPTLLILGGSDKGYDYGELFASLPALIKKIYLIGETSGKIAAAAERSGFLNIEKKASLEECVKDSLEEQGIDNVLLSPAAASFDMFRDYKHRGEVFETAVRDIKNRRGI